MSQCDQSSQLEHGQNIRVLRCCLASIQNPPSNQIKMHRSSLLLAIVGCLAVFASAEQTAAEQREHQQQQQQQSLQLQEPVAESLDAQYDEASRPHARAKRTLLLKKKLIGAGLLGFGLGAVKGYKLGYHSAPEVHHVIVAPPPPPVKYVEYVDKPIYLEKPVYKPHVEYEPAWSHHEPSPVYGPPSW